jgi:hypothetical protein
MKVVARSRVTIGMVEEVVYGCGNQEAVELGAPVSSIHLGYFKMISGMLILTIDGRTLLGLPKFQSSIFASVIRLSESITECQNTIARLIQREREQ